MFRTPLEPKRSIYQIDIQDPLFLTGSCFAENIGSKLNIFKFNTSVNPFGIIYNPISLFRLLSDSINFSKIKEENIIEHEQVFRHFEFHSDISALDKDTLIKKANEAYEKTGKFLKSAKWLIFSLGTAVVYTYTPTGQIVANCHKLPANQFNKAVLSVDEIMKSFSTCHQDLIRINPELKIIFTISPVRHIKDSFETNCLSKSILRIVVDGIIEKYSNTSYFPSYEIMMDDLRDYRFYKPDMVHPNEVAVNYIWKLFSETCFNERTIKFIGDWNKINTAISHRPFNPDTTLHKQFIKNTISQLLKFKELVNIDKELVYLETQLR